MRYLAVDLGAKRTGLAVGDDHTGLVSPLRTLEHPLGELLMAAIRKAIEEHGPDALVLGLPLNMDGSEGPSAINSRRFGAQLSSAFNLPVHHQDERLTSFAADQSLAQTGRTHGEKKALRDGLAAATMLKDFLDARVVSDDQTLDG